MECVEGSLLASLKLETIVTLSGIAESKLLVPKKMLEAAWRVLVIADAGASRTWASEAFELVVHSDRESALEALRDDPKAFDLAVIDLRDSTGAPQSLRLLCSLDALLSVVVFDEPGASAAACTRAGAFAVLERSAADDVVATSLARAGRHCRLERRVQALEARLATSESTVGLIGVSAAMRAVLAQVSRLGASELHVWIQGERGTGKHRVARAIHEASDRRQSPFVVFSCAALTEAQVECELFGQGKAANQGPVERPGAFARAQGGTLFLDEIASLPLPAQARLLALLDAEVAGDGQADLRIIVATRRDDDLVAGGHVLGALRDRLGVAMVQLSPLSKRLEDVPLLAAHFLARHGSSLGRQVESVFSEAAMDALCSYSWPGNVRELENAVRRALAISASGSIEVQALPRRVVGALSRAGRVEPVGALGEGLPAWSDPAWCDSHGFSEAKRLALQDFERVYLTRLLERTDGNISEAARIAGIDRSNLKRVLGRLGLRGAGAKG